MKEYDHIIIGFGKGGKTLAGALAKKGDRVALVERSDQMFGGTFPPSFWKTGPDCRRKWAEISLQMRPATGMLLRVNGT